MKLKIKNKVSKEINKSGNEYVSKLKEIMKINYTYNGKDIIDVYNTNEVRY